MIEDQDFYEDTKDVSKALLFYILIMSIIQGILLGMFDTGMLPESEVSTYVSFFSIPVVSLLFIHRYKKRFSVSLQLHKWSSAFNWKQYLYYLVLALGISWGSSLIFTLLIMPLSDSVQMVTPDFTPDGSLFSKLLDFTYAVILAPIFEEIIFRGIILQKLRKYGTAFSIIIVSLLFSLLHGNLPQSIPTFFLSIFLCVVTLRANSILPAISYHFILNMTAMISTSLPEASFMNMILNVLTFIVILVAFVLVLLYLSTSGLPQYPKNSWRIRDFFRNWAGILYLLLGLFNIIMMVQFL